MKTTLLQTAKETQFKLKDFEKTKAKYAHFIKKHADELEEVEYANAQTIEYYTKCHGYFSSLERQMDDARKTGKGIKTVVRSLRTLINGEAFKWNVQNAKVVLNCTDSMARSIATALYIVNYKKINREMKEALLCCVR